MNNTTKTVHFLASYPKSGNTWLRIFLNALHNSASTNDLDLNNLEGEPIFSALDYIRNILDVETSLIDIDFINKHHKTAFNYYISLTPRKKYIKNHGAYTYFKNVHTPSENCKTAIYILRNPLDVTVSLANFFDSSIDKAINKYINNPNGHFGYKDNFKGELQMYQHFGTWQMHVKSWIEQTNIPVHVVRYEDMLNDTFTTFKGITNALELDYNDIEIRNAIDATSFKKLQKKEQEGGFVEKPIAHKNFFNKGKANRWKEVLTQGQINSVKECNEEMMRKFGYWFD